MLLGNLRLFLTIAEKGSLVAAARETGMSSTTVSERLAALEAHYGVVLFNRTTRSISLTEEGRTLADGARSLLSEVADLDTLVRHGAETLSGPIRISAPIDLGRSIVSEVIAEFTEENPAVSSNFPSQTVMSILSARVSTSPFASATSQTARLGCEI